MSRAIAKRSVARAGARAEARATRLATRWAVVALFGFACGVAGSGGTAHASSPAPAPPAAPAGGLAEARDRASLEPSEPYWSYRMGELYRAAGHADSAEFALRTSLARDAYYAPSLSLLSKLYFESGRHAEAIELLETARAHPERFAGGFPPALLEGLALHYDALDRLEEAAAVLRHAVTGGPRPGSALVYLTLRGESPEAAEALADAALKQEPGNAVNLNNYGITRLRAGDLEAARQAFASAIERDPKLPGPYYNLAILEKFYRFDDAAAARWLGLYRERSSVDPDGLFEIFDAGAPSTTRSED